MRRPRPRSVPAPPFPVRDRAPPRPRAVVLFKFAIQDLVPAKAGIEHGLTMEEAIVLKEKTFHMYLFQIPITILSLADQYIKGGQYLAWQEDRVRKAADATAKSD